MLSDSITQKLIDNSQIFQDPMKTIIRQYHFYFSTNQTQVDHLKIWPQGSFLGPLQFLLYINDMAGNF